MHECYIPSSLGSMNSGYSLFFKCLGLVWGSHSLSYSPVPIDLIKGVMARVKPYTYLLALPNSYLWDSFCVRDTTQNKRKPLPSERPSGKTEIQYNKYCDCS